MKHVSILLAALVVILGVHTFTRADAPAGMQKWEYKRVAIGINDRQAETVLNGLGADGWDLAAVDPGGWFTFKRPISR